MDTTIEGQDLWRLFIGAHKQVNMLQSLIWRAFVRENGPADPEHDDLIKLLRGSLRYGGDSFVAANFAEHLPQGYKQALFADLLRVAARYEPKNGCWAAQRIIDALPKSWLSDNLRPSVERYLKEEEDATPSEVIKVMLEVDIGFAEELAHRAVETSDEFEVEIGEHYLKLINEARLKNDSPE